MSPQNPNQGRNSKNGRQENTPEMPQRKQSRQDTRPDEIPFEDERTKRYPAEGE